MSKGKPTVIPASTAHLMRAKAALGDLDDTSLKLAIGALCDAIQATDAELFVELTARVAALEGRLDNGVADRITKLEGEVQPGVLDRLEKVEKKLARMVRSGSETNKRLVEEHDRLLAFEAQTEDSIEEAEAYLKLLTKRITDLGVKVDKAVEDFNHGLQVAVEGSSNGATQLAERIKALEAKPVNAQTQDAIDEAFAKIMTLQEITKTVSYRVKAQETEAEAAIRSRQKFAERLAALEARPAAVETEEVASVRRKLAALESAVDDLYGAETEPDPHHEPPAPKPPSNPLERWAAAHVGKRFGKLTVIGAGWKIGRVELHCSTCGTTQEREWNSFQHAALNPGAGPDDLCQECRIRATRTRHSDEIVAKMSPIERSRLLRRVARLVRSSQEVEGDEA